MNEDCLWRENLKEDVSDVLYHEFIKKEIKWEKEKY